MGRPNGPTDKPSHERSPSSIPQLIRNLAINKGYIESSFDFEAPRAPAVWDRKLQRKKGTYPTILFEMISKRGALIRANSASFSPFPPTSLMKSSRSDRRARAAEDQEV